MDRFKWCKPCIRIWQRSHSRRVYEERGDEDYTYVRAPQDTCDLAAQIPPLYRGAVLEDLPEGLVQVYRELPEYKGLYLWGEPGRGKTYAMAAITKDLWARGYDVTRITYEWLMLHIRDSFKPGSGHSEQDAITPYIETDALVVEDVGTTASEKETDFSMRIFFVLLNTRLEWMRPTFITSNRTPEQLGEQFNSRIESRLMAACQAARLMGPDWRKQQ